MTEMTKPLLRKLCKDNGLYTTPSINDKLYLHFRGFSKITNLDEYTGLKALWLEGNGLTEISGLEHQTLLRTLYLHENLIERIEGLDSQVDLDTLNLSKNFIKVINNLSHMKKLTSLNLANNLISHVEDIRHLVHLPSLQTIDLQQNKIEDVGIVDIIGQLPDLRVLYLQGNPVVKKIPHYRKTIIARCERLKYLDDRPVFDDERRRVTAWAKVILAGGSIEEAQAAERLEIDLIRKEKDEADERNFRAFEQLMKEGLEIRKQREAARAAGQMEEKVNPYTGETVIDVAESEDLRILREKRLAALNGNATLTTTTPPLPPPDALVDNTHSEAMHDLPLPPPPPVVDAVAAAEPASIEGTTDESIRPVPATVENEIQNKQILKDMRKMVIEEVEDEDANQVDQAAEVTDAKKSSDESSKEQSLPLPPPPPTTSSEINYMSLD
eukprot:gene4336-4759_t